MFSQTLSTFHELTNVFFYFVEPSNRQNLELLQSLALGYRCSVVCSLYRLLLVLRKVGYHVLLRKEIVLQKKAHGTSYAVGLLLAAGWIAVNFPTIE